MPVFDQRVSMPDASSPFMRASAAELLARSSVPSQDGVPAR